MTEPAAICSFCGKTQDEVRTIVAGFIANICDECIVLCVDILIAQGVSPGWLLWAAWKAAGRNVARWMVPSRSSA